MYMYNYYISIVQYTQRHVHVDLFFFTKNTFIARLTSRHVSEGCGEINRDTPINDYIPTMNTAVA